MKRTILAIAIALASGQAAAWGTHTHDYTNTVSGASASQFTAGANSVRSTSASYNNGSAYNAAAASTYVAGKSRADASRGFYSASVEDVKVVDTATYSNNTGTAGGNAEADAFAFGAGEVEGGALSSSGTATYTNYFHIPLGKEKNAFAASGASGEMVNGVAATSSSGHGKGGNGFSEAGGEVGAGVSIEGHALTTQNTASARDAKAVSTRSYTYQSGVNSFAIGGADANARGGVVEWTKDSDVSLGFSN